MPDSVPGTAIVRPQERPAQSTWPMTELDSANALLVIRGAWLFDRPLDAARLRDGLARVLSQYPHLVGRIKPGRGIELTEGGVPFHIATRRETAIGDVMAEPSLAHRFADRLRPLLVQRGLQPLLVVRLTQLGDGTLLTVTCSHAALDGNAFYTFVRNWSWTCSGRQFPRPVLDPSLVPAALACTRDEAVKQARAAGWTPVTPWVLGRLALLSLTGRLSGRCKVLDLSPGALEGLRTAVAGAAARAEVGTFEALAAHLTRMCGRLVGLPAGTRCQQVTVLDARRRIATLPAEYVGNAAFTVTAADFVAGAPLGEIAQKIHAGLAPFASVPSSELTRGLALGRALVRHRAWFMPYDVTAMHAAAPTLTYINNFRTLPIYDIDFGSEGAPVAPLLAIPHDLPDPVLIWPAPPVRGGVEVYFTGRYARAVRQLPVDDHWWRELREHGPG